MDKDLNIKVAYVYSVLSTISVKTEAMDFSDNSLIAVTAAGTIIGTYVSETVDELKTDTDFIVSSNICDIASEHTNDPSKVIFLKDATLFSSNGIKSCFKYLYLFIEDIIALSFGNMYTN